MTPTVLPLLTSDGLVLRGPADGELETLAHALANDPESRPWFGHDPAVIARWLSEDGVGALVIEADGTPGGIITFEEEQDPDYHSAGIDIGLLSCCVGRGIGPRAVHLLARWLFCERGHHRITIDPAAANARAIRAYEKVGFRPVGVMRLYERGPDGWHDSLLMDMLASDLSDPDERTSTE